MDSNADALLYALPIGCVMGPAFEVIVNFALPSFVAESFDSVRLFADNINDGEDVPELVATLEGLLVACLEVLSWLDVVVAAFAPALAALSVLADSTCPVFSAAEAVPLMTGATATGSYLLAVKAAVPTVPIDAVTAMAIISEAALCAFMRAADLAKLARLAVRTRLAAVVVRLSLLTATPNIEYFAYSITKLIISQTV